MSSTGIGPQVNSTNKWRMTLRDDAGAAVTTATVTVTITDPNGVIRANAVSAPHQGAGVYLYTSLPAVCPVAGVYTLVWSAVDAIGTLTKTDIVKVIA